jgi:cytochrome P450
MTDLTDPATFAHGHPLALYERLRKDDPVHFNAEANGPGFFALTRYADVRAADRDFQTFSSEPTIMIPDPDPAQQAAFGPYKMMLMMDPPQHTAFRKLIRGAFTQEAALTMKTRFATLAREIVDAVIARGECDFVADVAGEMPSFVIAELMGLPRDDGRELYKLTEIIHTAPESLAPGAGQKAIMDMFAYGRGVIVQKRAKPGDDLATRILQAEVDGQKLDDVEFLLFFMLLIDAGGDTTRNLISAGALALHEHPDQKAWLLEDMAGRLPAAREELLRYASPVVYMRRTATRDTEIAGRAIAAGQKVVMYFGAANRDPAMFSDPDRLDLARTPNEHIAFGDGPHACLGKHIARLEIDAMLTEVLTRMPDVAPSAPPEWLPSTFISGLKTMPVTFTPGSA